MAPPSYGLSKLLTFALHLILGSFRQLGCDLIQEAPALELLLVGGGALSIANRYELIIEHYTIPRIGSVKLKELTTRHLQKLYKELLESGRIHIGKNQDKSLSTTTVRSVHLMLHCALDRAVKERLIQRNPSEDCIVPKPRKLDIKILPPEHIHAYLEAAQARGLLGSQPT